MSDSDLDPGDAAYICDGCSKAYNTRNSLAQHKRLYCRPNLDPTNTCVDCQRSFNTYAGLQQHRRKAHAAAYQADLEAQDHRRTAPISRLETLDIAQAEIAHEGTAPINKYLAARFKRPVDEIRNLRKRRQYLSLRAQLEADQKEAPDHPTASPPRIDEVQPPTPRQPTPPIVWPSPPPPTLPDQSIVAGIEGNESFYALNLPQDEVPESSPSLAEEIRVAGAAPHSTNSDFTPGSPGSSVPSGDDIFVADDLVKAYLESLVLNSLTPPNIRDLGLIILSDDTVAAHAAVDDLYGALWTPPAPTLRGPPLAPRASTPDATARSRRAYRFKRYQELYVKDLAALASSIVSGLEPGSHLATPTLEEVEGHYQEVFAGASPPDAHAVVDFKKPTGFMRH